MELKMKAICEGRKTKSGVVEESLGQYREVFIITTRRINVLKAVCGHPRLNSSLLASICKISIISEVLADEVN
jgi:hypothetical protein